jgi:hypothetical protein
LNDKNSTLGAAYASSELAKLDCSRMSSTDVDYSLNRVSECHASFFQKKQPTASCDQQNPMKDRHHISPNG